MKQDSTDRIIDTLQGQPWNLVPRQIVDFCAWLCGWPEGKFAALHELPAGDHAFVFERLHDCRAPRALIHRWVDERHAARQALTLAALEAEAAEWLR